MPLFVRGQSERHRAPGEGARFVRREAPASGRCRKTEMVKEIPSFTRSSKSVAKYPLAPPMLPMLMALAVGFVVLTAPASSVSAQTFNWSFAVSPESSELEVVNQAGTIRVYAGANPTRIVINARQSDGAPKISATQNVTGKVKVEVTGQGNVDFEIAVPPSS